MSGALRKETTESIGNQVLRPQFFGWRVGVGLPTWEPSDPEHCGHREGLVADDTQALSFQWARAVPSARRALTFSVALADEHHATGTNEFCTLEVGLASKKRRSSPPRYRLVPSTSRPSAEMNGGTGSSSSLHLGGVVFSWPRSERGHRPGQPFTTTVRVARKGVGSSKGSDRHLVVSRHF